MKTFENVKKLQMKPLDFLVILILMMASFAPFLLLSSRTQAPSNFAQLRVNGKVIKTFNLSKNSSYRYKAKDGDINDIAVKNGKIGIVYANCDDQICVRKGFIDKVGQTIVCLPHKLVIEVMTSSNKPEDNKDNKVVDYG
ncbi:NusG domain II-containing protein [Lactococcus insecticola]|uniref:Protein export element n=1 Tax=Pseudolactococcus insecticola TaxID=2709158 RepID=A0A6A0B431_9LACT|nr:NusG domain II-containing protein [Lactococcus insecticola]GFH40080.1 protein export element [Lactococcus insecticola]